MSFDHPELDIIVWALFLKGNPFLKVKPRDARLIVESYSYAVFQFIHQEDFSLFYLSVLNLEKVKNNSSYLRDWVSVKISKFLNFVLNQYKSALK